VVIGAFDVVLPDRTARGVVHGFVGCERDRRGDPGGAVPAGSGGGGSGGGGGGSANNSTGAGGFGANNDSHLNFGAGGGSAGDFIVNGQPNGGTNGQSV
jgi:hypothetical protein